MAPSEMHPCANIAFEVVSAASSGELMSSFGFDPCDYRNNGGVPAARLDERMCNHSEMDSKTTRPSTELSFVELLENLHRYGMNFSFLSAVSDQLLELIFAPAIFAVNSWLSGSDDRIDVRH